MTLADRSCDSCGGYVPFREAKVVGKLCLCPECVEKPAPPASIPVRQQPRSNGRVCPTCSRPFGATGMAGTPVTEMHRQLIREGLERARKAGKRLGRPPTPFPRRPEMLALRAKGLGTRSIAREMGVSRMKIRRELHRAIAVVL